MLLVVVSMLLPLASACSSPWREAYTGVEVGTLARVEAAEVREVPWGRVRAALDEVEAARAVNDTHVSEWTGAAHVAEKARLLRGLQVSDDPATVTVLGRSVFRSTDRLRPSDVRLRRFAKRLGADLIVVSNVYTGKAERIEHETVTRYTDRYVGARSHRDRSHGKHKHRHGYYEPVRETYTVPVVVEADEFAWIVYFLRRSGQ